MADHHNDESSNQDGSSIQQSLHSDIRLAVTGDPQAWNRLYDRYRPMLSKWSQSLNHGNDVSHRDLAQEAWIRIFVGLNKFEFKDASACDGLAARFYVWIRQTAKRAMINKLVAENAQKRRPKKFERDFEQLPDRQILTPSSIVIREEEQARIRVAIDQLSSPVDQQIIQMAVWDGHSLHAIADVLGMEYTALRRKYHSILLILQASCANPDS